MPAVVQHSAQSSDPTSPAANSVRLRLIKPIVFFLAGLSVAFTGAQHVDLNFDRLLIGSIFFILGMAQLVDWRFSQPHLRSNFAFVTAAAGFVACGLQFLVTTPLAFTIVIAAWGVVTGFCDILTGRTIPAQRGDSNFLGVLAIVMAILCLVFATDPIAVAGFFGAYAVVAGVFMGISVIDTNAKAKRLVQELADAADSSDNTAPHDSEPAAESASTNSNESTA